MWVGYAHNTLWHSSLGMSPFECQFDYSPPMFAEQEEEVGVPAALPVAIQRSTHAANHKRCMAFTFLPGKWMWLAIKDLPLQFDSKKLAPHYIGPFKILRRVNPVLYCLELPRSMNINPFMSPGSNQSSAVHWQSLLSQPRPLPISQMDPQPLGCGGGVL